MCAIFARQRPARIPGLPSGRRCWGQGVGCRVEGVWFRVWGVRCQMEGAGCRVCGVGPPHPWPPQRTKVLALASERRVNNVNGSRNLNLNSKARIACVPYSLDRAPPASLASRASEGSRSLRPSSYHSYRGTSFIRNTPPVEPYSRPKPRALWLC